MKTKISYDVSNAERMSLEAQPNRVMQTRVRKWNETNPCSIVASVCINEERRWEFEIESEKPIELTGNMPQFLTVVGDDALDAVVIPAPEVDEPAPVSEIDTPSPVVTTAELPKKKKRGRPSKNKR